MMRSASPMSATALAARSIARLDEACARTGGRSTAVMRIDDHRSRTASAIDPPISPRPTMAMRSNGGSSEVITSTPNYQLPHPNHPQLPISNDWELGIGRGWELGVGNWELSRPTTSRDRLDAA